MSPELRLIAACCRWPDDDARRRQILLTAGEVGDWPAVESLMIAHRVPGLVAQGLLGSGLDLPEGLRERLTIAAQQTRAAALAQLNETLRLSHVLDRAGIQHVVLKGIPLGLAAYGTPSLKQSWDIDLLVDPLDAVRAALILQELDYRPDGPGAQFGQRQFEALVTTTKEVILTAPSGLVVELHWRVSDHPLLLRGLDVESGRRDIPVLGPRALPAFSLPANLAYLAVHGAFHGWSRLKWLADFAALLRSTDPEQLRSAIAEARRFQAGRALDQALVLSERIFGVELATIALADRDTRRLVDLALEVIEARSARREIEDDATAQVAIRKAQWLLAPGLAYRGLIALRWLRGSEDRKAFALPRGLRWAYWPMRPFTAACRVIGRRVRRR